MGRDVGAAIGRATDNNKVLVIKDLNATGAMAHTLVAIRANSNLQLCSDQSLQQANVRLNTRFHAVAAKLPTQMLPSGLIWRVCVDV